MTQFKILIALAIILLNLEFLSAKEKDFKIKLRSYESNLIGYRWDEDDVGSMDFRLSLLYPMLHDGEVPKGDKFRHFWKGPVPFMSFAFSGRFSQYIGTRDSSPVISKRFNPKVIGRIWIKRDGDRLDIAFEHESNGQSINTATGYTQQQLSHIAKGEDPKFARDTISRGWDYVSLEYKHDFSYHRNNFSVTWKLSHFLNDGPLQGAQEEVRTWEGFGSQPARDEVDGLRVTFRSWFPLDLGPIEGNLLDVGYMTGIKQAFRHSTFKWSAGLRLWSFPVRVWGHHGYVSDLVDYHRSLNSYGLSFELKSFLRPWLSPKSDKLPEDGQVDHKKVP